MSVPQTIKQLSYIPTISILDKYQREIGIYIHIKTYMWIFVVALFIIVKVETTQTSTKKWMYKQMVIYPDHGILLAIERNEVMIHVPT